MIEIKDIIPYVKGNSRNKIIFTKSRIVGLKYINIGLKMSKLIHNTKNMTSDIITIYYQTFNQNSLSDEIGSYLAIENIGILFEPDLHLNLESIFETYSRDEVLIVSCPGEIINNIFYFFSANSHFKIPLERLSYKIYDN